MSQIKSVRTDFGQLFLSTYSLDFVSLVVGKQFMHEQGTSIEVRAHFFLMALPVMKGKQPGA